MRMTQWIVLWCLALSSACVRTQTPVAVSTPAGWSFPHTQLLQRARQEQRFSSVLRAMQSRAYASAGEELARWLNTEDLPAPVRVTTLALFAVCAAEEGFPLVAAAHLADALQLAERNDEPELLRAVLRFDAQFHTLFLRQSPEPLQRVSAEERATLRGEERSVFFCALGRSQYEAGHYAEAQAAFEQVDAQAFCADEASEGLALALIAQRNTEHPEQLTAALRAANANHPSSFAQAASIVSLIAQAIYSSPVTRDSDLLQGERGLSLLAEAQQRLQQLPQGSSLRTQTTLELVSALARFRQRTRAWNLLQQLPANVFETNMVAMHLRARLRLYACEPTARVQQEWNTAHTRFQNFGTQVEEEFRSSSPSEMLRHIQGTSPTGRTERWTLLRAWSAAPRWLHANDLLWTQEHHPVLSPARQAPFHIIELVEQELRQWDQLLIPLQSTPFGTTLQSTALILRSVAEDTIFQQHAQAMLEGLGASHNEYYREQTEHLLSAYSSTEACIPTGS